MKGLLNIKPLSLNSILNGFHKTLGQLQSLAQSNRAKADLKTQQAAKLVTEHNVLVAEARQAEEAHARIAALVGAVGSADVLEGSRVEPEGHFEGHF